MIKNRLKELRNERGWTLDVLAEKTNISKQHLNRLENHHPNARLNETNIAKLCEAYGVQVSELFEKGRDMAGADLALVYAIKSLITNLIFKKSIKKEWLKDDLQKALIFYQDQNAPGATLVLSDLLGFLDQPQHQSKQVSVRKLLELSPAIRQ